MNRDKRKTISEKVIHHLIGKIYDAAMNYSQWQSVLEGVADAVGAPRALLLSHTRAPEHGGTWVFHGLGPELLQPYMEHFVHQDLWHQAGLTRGVEVSGTVVTGESLIDDRTLFQSEFYNDYLRRMGLFRLCTTIIHDGTELPVPNVHLSLYRPKAQPSFSDDNVRTMHLLYPHLKRALSINYRLMTFEKQTDSVVRATEQINEGTILVNEHRRVIMVNEAADRILAKSAAVRIQNGKVEVGNPVENATFAALVMATCDPLNKIMRDQPDVMVVKQPDSAIKFKLVVCPIEVPFLSARSPKAQAIIFISEEPASAEEVMDSLAKYYRLTNAEVRVIKGVTEGRSLKGIADHLNVSVNTVQSQIKSVYSKTNIHRQAELVRLVMTWCS